MKTASNLNSELKSIQGIHKENINYFSWLQTPVNIPEESKQHK
jgi:hypothetical protein